MPLEFRPVTSRANEQIKRIRSLEMRKYRAAEGVFITEGLRHALEAAEAGWEFETLVIEDGMRDKDLVRRLLGLVEHQNCLCLEVPADIMESLTRRENAQAVLAVIKQRWVDLSALRDYPPAVWVALEEIRDPGNLGTIIRTADAVDARGIILIENTCDPYSIEAIRASMGSFPHVALIKCTRAEFLDFATTSDFQIIGTHLKMSLDYRNVAYKNPLIVLMGNEQAGLTDSLSAACTQLVKIPMRGKADSLNVSVATAIMLYEVNRESLGFPDAG